MNTDDEIKQQLRNAFPGLGLQPIDQFRPAGIEDSKLRRDGSFRPDSSEIELLALTRDASGVLRWELGFPAATALEGGRRASALRPGAVVERFAFKKIPRNEVGAALQKIDGVLTPRNGLRRWNPDTRRLEPFQGSDAAGKKILLLIHGTFSNCDNTVESFLKAPGNVGLDLLDAAARGPGYDHVLTFDHPTVGVSPLLNAFDLSKALLPRPAGIDVVTHSRGGLVTRWFLEGFLDPAIPRRAVFVASTLAGTSLAAPHRLKSALNHLANVGALLGGSASKMPHPFLYVSGSLFQFLASVVKFGAATPALDAAVALVPGLQGQSRVGNNPELLRLRANHSGVAGYSAIRCDFQPRDPGWNFLQYFSKPLQRVANRGADLVFEGPNDLVVDTDSTDDIADQTLIPASALLDYGTTDTVHHTNFFEQERTVRFIRRQLAF